MKGLLLVLVTSAVLTLTAFALGYSASPANAHRHGCHRAHSCPSDHATYRWRGTIGGVTARWLCVYRFAEERNRTFNRRVRYGGRVYYCKR
jgi:hypothetical protein